MVEKLNGTLTKSLKKLSIAHPEDWDLHLPAVLYSYRTKSHEALKVSPFELLYGQSPRSYRQDILQSFGLSLGYERLNKLVNRTVLSEDQAPDYPDQPVEENIYAPGTKVIRIRPNKTSKLDTKFSPEIYV
ncbi:hypothetical protein CLU79DRAFT_460608 [Phycomyces nitens]|nr:hypothetical protein CLU79DRAFT_460608 [Phycomyces nitens]